MSVVIFAKNFRGFKSIEVDTSKFTFLIGDNSSGKSSILHLVYMVLTSGLRSVPRMKAELGVGEYDYFSKYFNNQDVTIGFIKSEPDGNYGKVVTLKKGPGLVPKITKCTFIAPEVAVTVKRRGKRAQYKITKRGFSCIDDITKEHQLTTGYKTGNDLLGRIEVSDPSVLFVGFRRPDELTPDLAASLFGTILPSATFLGPIRSMPEKYYEHDRKISPMGTHFATMWHEFENRWLSDHSEKVKTFGTTSGLFDSLHVEQISRKFPDSPFIVSIERHGKRFLLNQVGVGVSQVVPVIVESLYASSMKGGRVALMQQPELHLHPVAQAALGSFLFSMANSGLHGFMETHSSFLVDRFRSDLRATSEVSDSSVTGQIIFCENSEQGNLAHLIEISKFGELLNAPDSYHQFFIDEYMRTLF